MTCHERIYVSIDALGHCLQAAERLFLWMERTYLISVLLLDN